MTKNILIALFLVIATQLSAQSQKQQNKNLNKLFENYYEEGLKLFPLRATSVGDNRYNHLLYADFTNSYREKIKNYYSRYLNELSKYTVEDLDRQDRLSALILKDELETSLAGLELKDNRMPANQMNAVPLYLAQLGSGSVVQPFKTVTDYENWILRASAFPAWTDSAIVYFKKGIAEGIVLPKSLVTKMIPQMDGLISEDVTKSVFYGPIAKMPNTFSEKDKARLQDQYLKLIEDKITPSYKKLLTFLKEEYLPKSRPTSGINSLPGGEEMYKQYIRSYTTTNKSADELYNTGISEVKRIQGEMERIKTSLEFNGDLNAMFEYLKTDPKFFPYKTAEEVLEAYRDVQKKIDPNLKKLFKTSPKTPFEIKQTESFRAASTPPQYFRGSLENNRPGIFYVPIVDPAKTSIDEAIFLHEAIPGHHYQIALQQENQSLPKFRRYGGNGAYMEGWGLYTESLFALCFWLTIWRKAMIRTAFIQST